MSKKRTFIVETGEGTPRILVSNGAVAEWRDEKTGYYSRLEEHEGCSFTYHWKHNGSKGEMEIPDHVIFALPELLTILNTCRKHALFSETRIYERTGAVLFSRGPST